MDFNAKLNSKEATDCILFKIASASSNNGISGPRKNFKSKVGQLSFRSFFLGPEIPLFDYCDSPGALNMPKQDPTPTFY